MESNSQSLSTDNSDTKAAFRKPSNDAANRKYRRRSPVTGSSSSGSFKRERSSSPVFPRKGDSSVSNFSQRRKDDREREMNLESGRTQSSRRSDSYKHSDRHSSRSSHGYSKHEDYVRADKHADDEEKKYQRPSSQAGRGSRGGNISENMRIESEYSRSRDYGRNTDRHEKYDCSGHRKKDRERGSSSLEDDNFKGKDSLSERTGSSRRHASTYYEGIRSGMRNRHNRDRGGGRDERRDYDRSFRGNRNGHVLSHEQSKGCQDDPITARNNSGDLPKDADRSQFKEYDVQKHDDVDKVKYDYGESKRDNDQYTKEIGKQFDDRTLAMSGSKESLAKKPKLFSLDKVDESQSSNVKSSKEIFNKMESGQNRSGITTSDLNAAKVAAMKAAELVNRNLVGVGVGVGVGVMSTEQKKKLLWGNKKSTTSEESAHRWDTALFSDRERQEKFNKLMSLRLPCCLWPIVGCEGRGESGAEPQQSRQRETEGTPAGFGEAVHCWTPTKRWSHCWPWPLGICCTEQFGYWTATLCDILYYMSAETLFMVVGRLWLIHSSLLCDWVL